MTYLDIVPNGTKPEKTRIENGKSVPDGTPIDTRSRMHERVNKRDDKQRTTEKEELVMVRRFKRHTTVDPVGDEKFRQMLFKKAGQEPAKEI
jgi:hypothetical protein